MSREQWQRAAIWLAIAAAVGMFVVLLMGSTVTVTGSGEGCGASWPLCNGRFVPEFAVSTAIEYSHRLVTGIEGFLILGAAIGAAVFWRQRVEVRVLVPLVVLFLVLQAALGALAVTYQSWWGRDWVLAFHFGISLLAFATTLLLALVLLGIQRGFDQLRDQTVPVAIRWATWGLALYTYGVVYIGAYVRHTDASLACLDWPLCQGTVFPGFSGPVGSVFSHRVSAALLTLGTGALFAWCWRRRAIRPDLAWASAIALLMVLAQGASGAAVVFSRVQLFSALSHGLFVTLFFGGLAYCCLAVLPRSCEIRARAVAASARDAYRPAPSAVSGESSASSRSL